jgi:two-component system, OmpR family, phosphate regulon response regulator PhoB
VAVENNPRVLVVDDDAELLGLVKMLLTRVGIEVVTAVTAGAAAQILRQPPLPHLLILDMMLPDVSGLELLRQLRSKEVFDTLPVIILSALADPSEIRKGLDAGADRYVTKPYVAHNLTKVVQELLRTGRQREQKQP